MRSDRVSLETIRIETPRLILRPIAREDFDAWAAFMADEESARFIGGAQPRAAAWRGFLTMAGAWTMQVSATTPTGSITDASATFNVLTADGKVQTPEIAPTPSPPVVTPAPTTTVAAPTVTTG